MEGLGRVKRLEGQKKSQKKLDIFINKITFYGNYTSCYEKMHEAGKSHGLCQELSYSQHRFQDHRVLNLCHCGSFVLILAAWLC